MPVNMGLTNTVIQSLMVSGSNIFAGTQGGGVFLTTANGASWTAINNGLTNKDVRAFATNGGNLFAATNQGVFRSSNNGVNWIYTNIGLSNTTNAIG